MKTAILGVAFVGLGFASKILPWAALSSLVGKGSLLIPAMGALIAGALTWLGLRRFAQARLAGVAFVPTRRGWLLAPFGIGAGVLLQTCVVALSLVAGSLSLSWNQVSGADMLGPVAFGIVFAAANSAWEEYTLRGFPLSAFGRLCGGFGGVLITSLLFSALHLMNPKCNMTMLGETALAGLLLGFSVLAGRTIMLAIGLHTGWNVAESFYSSSRWWTVRGETLSSAELGVTAVAAGIFWLWASRSRRHAGVQMAAATNPEQG